MKQHHVEERYRVLLEVNNAIITSLSRESLFKAIGQTLQEVLPFDRLSITLLDPTKDLVQVNAVSSGKFLEKYLPVGTELPLHESPLAFILEHKRPLSRHHLER